MLRRFIFIGNRSHAGISSCVSAFCVFRAGGRQWPPSDSPRTLILGDLNRASGEQGNWDSSEQEGLSYISIASAQFQGTNLIDYLTVIASTAQRGQQSTHISHQEKMEYTMSQSQRTRCTELKEETWPLPLFYTYFGPGSVLMACESWGSTAH